MTGQGVVSCGGGAASSLLVGWGVLGVSGLGGVVLVCCVRVVRWGWLGQMVGTPYGGVVGWFHAGVRPWGLSALLLAVGFPCPLAPC